VEVERVLAEHPSVAQVAIVAKADTVLGEIGVAFIVPAPHETSPTLAMMREWTKRSVADYKAPDLIKIVSELPLTSVGKVDKRVLADRARDVPRVT
jgi:non-ribosomal peptide synthetase component E (peptide arylation enzyme)